MRQGRRALTLAEVMLAAGLVAVLYTIMAYITVQVSQASRRGAAAAMHKLELFKSCEQLRWQLRGLYVPVEYSVKPEASPSPSPGAPSPTPPADADVAAASKKTASRPGFVPGLVLMSQRTDTPDSDILIFLTNAPQGSRGVAEVGYKLQVNDGRTALYYRQFSYRDPDGLHTPTDAVEAPWKPLNTDVITFWAEYSAEDSSTWQREWDSETPPTRIRLNLSTRSGEKLTFTVVPGVSSARW